MFLIHGPMSAICRRRWIGCWGPAFWRASWEKSSPRRHRGLLCVGVSSGSLEMKNQAVAKTDAEASQVVSLSWLLILYLCVWTWEQHPLVLEMWWNMHMLDKSSGIHMIGCLWYEVGTRSELGKTAGQTNKMLWELKMMLATCVSNFSLVPNSFHCSCVQ